MRRGSVAALVALTFAVVTSTRAFADEEDTTSDAFAAKKLPAVYALPTANGGVEVGVGGFF